MSNIQNQVSTNFYADIRSKLDKYTADLDHRGYINGSILVAYQIYWV
jgi:hypothetical protein